MKQASVVEFNTRRVVASITRPANVTAYADGDAMSDVTGDAHLTFDRAVRKRGNSPSGVINSARITSSANQTTLPDVELWLFSADIADTADNAAWAPSDAETLTRIGVIRFELADWQAMNRTSGANGNAGCELHNLGILFVGAGEDIYGQLVARNAYTPVSSEVFTVELVLTQD